jgi:hypothetical protein
MLYLKENTEGTEAEQAEKKRLQEAKDQQEEDTLVARLVTVHQICVSTGTVFVGEISAVFVSSDVRFYWEN